MILQWACSPLNGYNWGYTTWGYNLCSITPNRTSIRLALGAENVIRDCQESPCRAFLMAWAWKKWTYQQIPKNVTLKSQRRSEGPKEPSLPPFWEKHFSEQHKMPYFWNSKTKDHGSRDLTIFFYRDRNYGLNSQVQGWTWWRMGMHGFSRGFWVRRV